MLAPFVTKKMKLYNTCYLLVSCVFARQVWYIKSYRSSAWPQVLLSQPQTSSQPGGAKLRRVCRKAVERAKGDQQPDHPCLLGNLEAPK